MLSVQQSSGLDHTTRLQRKAISEATSIEPESLKTLLKRLRRDGYLVRREARHGRGESGCVFEIPSATALALQRQDRQPKGEQQRGTKGNFKGEQPPPLVSSSDLKTTTTDKQRAERFQNACEKFGLQEIGLGANDLLQIWRRGVFESDDDYLASIEHLAFYLSTADAKGITHPKAWLTSQLAKGFYPAPAGFKSWEERQQEAILAAKRERLAKLEELKRQQLEADFELWIAELSVEAKQRKLAGTPFAEQPASKLARSMLRDVFLRERGEAAD